MNHFVFVVCGGKEFIEELNFSLKFLRYFSKYPILVVTDSIRNEIEILHDNILNIKTPSKYSNHQAHLFLETSLVHHVKPQKNDVFCYLDSDIIAISEDINNIFYEFTSPINFAPDHCTIDYFSAGIMNCNCKNEFEQIEKQFHIMQNFFPEPEISNDIVISDRESLHSLFQKMKSNPFSSGLKGLKYYTNRHFLLSSKILLDNDFYFIRSDRCWYNKSGQLIDYDYGFYKNKLWKEYGIRYKNERWENKGGKPLSPETPNCKHLREHIKKIYNITINPNWQHWNGGVFLFDQNSTDFMNLWHKNMLMEFEFKNKIIFDDQGTLAASVWQKGIQNNKKIPVKYNFITDPENKNVQYLSNTGFTYDGFTTIFNPCFLHIYHNWGDEKWEIWQAVIEIGKKHSIL